MRVKTLYKHLADLPRDMEVLVENICSHAGESLSPVTISVESFYTDPITGKPLTAAELDLTDISKYGPPVGFLVLR